MVENTILLQNSKNACFDNVIFLLICYTSAFKTRSLGEVLYFTDYIYSEIPTLKVAVIPCLAKPMLGTQFEFSNG